MSISGNSTIFSQGPYLRCNPFLLAAALISDFSLTIAKELTIDRLVASPSLSGPVAKGVELSPDGKAQLFPMGADFYYLKLDSEVRRLTETEAKSSRQGGYVLYVRE